METAYRKVVNVFYRKMNDLDTRKRFPHAVIVDHNASMHAIETWRTMNQIHRLAMCLGLLTVGRKN